MLSLRFLALALVLALCTTAQAVVISPTDVALTAGNISTDDDALELSRSFADTLHPVSASAGRTAVELAVIASNTQLASAVCSTGSTAACIAAAVFTVLWNFFAIWRVSNTAPGAIHPARDGLGVLTLVHSQWLPSADCSVACRLHAGAVENSWTLFANSTAAGVTHDLHFIRSGTISGIRATRSTSGGGRDKRQDVDDDGGMVVSYYWDNGNETAWAAWDSSQTDWAANAVSSYIVANNGEVVCADIEDPTGHIAAGVMTVGWNNVGVTFNTGSLQNALDICATDETAGE